MLLNSQGNLLRVLEFLNCAGQKYHPIIIPEVTAPCKSKRYIQFITFLTYGMLKNPSFLFLKFWYKLSPDN